MISAIHCIIIRNYDSRRLRRARRRSTSLKKIIHRLILNYDSRCLPGARRHVVLKYFKQNFNILKNLVNINLYLYQLSTCVMNVFSKIVKLLNKPKKTKISSKVLSSKDLSIIFSLKILVRRGENWRNERARLGIARGDGICIHHLRILVDWATLSPINLTTVLMDCM